jgi:GGDEF domain-containing protein
MQAHGDVDRRIIDFNREIAVKNQKLEEAARTDSLTGLPNQRAIEDWTGRRLRDTARLLTVGRAGRYR